MMNMTIRYAFSCNDCTQTSNGACACANKTPPKEKSTAPMTLDDPVDAAKLITMTKISKPVFRSSSSGTFRTAFAK